MDREILPNIQTFVQLVQVTNGKGVSQWDETALRKALRWGQYAEKLYSKVYQRQEIAEKLSRCLQRIQLPTGGISGSKELSFQDLKHSRKIIVKNLLDNPSLSSELFHLMLKSLSSPSSESLLVDVIDLEEFTKFAEEGASLKSTVKVLSSIDSTLAEKVDDRHFPATDIMIDAHLLRAHLLYQLSHERTASDSKTEGFGSLLHSVAVKPGGLEVIGSVLGLEKPKHPLYTDACLNECEEIVFKWLMENKNDYKDR